MKKPRAALALSGGAVTETWIINPTSDSFLNLREGPASDHAIKRRIYPGDFAVVLEWSGNWTRILTRDGTFDYAHSRWLR